MKPEITHGQRRAVDCSRLLGAALNRRWPRPRYERHNPKQDDIGDWESRKNAEPRGETDALADSGGRPDKKQARHAHDRENDHELWNTDGTHGLASDATCLNFRRVNRFALPGVRLTASVHQRPLTIARAAIRGSLYLDLPFARRLQWLSGSALAWA
jgi:hypothetical protein